MKWRWPINPEPWRASADDRDEGARALRLLHDLGGAPPSEARLERVLRRVRTEIAVGGRRAPALGLRLAVLALLLTAGGVGVASVVHFRKGLLPTIAPQRHAFVDPRQRGVTPAPMVMPTPAVPPALVQAAPEPPHTDPALAQPTPLKARAAVGSNARVVTHQSIVASPVPLSAPSPDALAEETAALKFAMGRLRAGSPAEAIERLDGYDQSFPRGVLRREAAVVRVEALIAADRGSEALSRLEALPLDQLPRRTEMRVVLGELRGATGRCADALPTFEAALREDPPQALRERAEYGRTVCWARLGRDDEARAGFAAYLRRFPQGRFAAQARQALGR